MQMTSFERPAQRRLSRAIALEPGGRRTAQARIANKLIKALMRSAWQYGPATDAGLILLQRVMDLLGHATRVPPGVAITPERFTRPSGSEWVRAGAPDEGKVFIYMHGGGYFFGSPRLNRPFTWRLSAATGRPVLAVDYRLAPQHPPSDALQDALEAYNALLERNYRPENIVVGGDSAGGHLTLALLLTLKEQGEPMPRAAILLSPWVDMMCASESHKLNKRRDVLIPADKFAWLGRKYCEGKEDNDTLYAPLRGDLTGLPPMMFMASGSEILRDDAREAAARAQAADVEVVHQEWQGLVHAFPTFADFIPEGKAAFRHMAEFLRRVERRAD